MDDGPSIFLQTVFVGLQRHSYPILGGVPVIIHSDIPSKLSLSLEHAACVNTTTSSKVHRFSGDSSTF